MICDKTMEIKILAFILILLIAVYPVSADDVSIDKLALNITLGENGLVEVVMQTEIHNTGTSALDGYSFTVPFSAAIDKEQSSGVTVNDDGNMNFNAPDAKVQSAPGGTNIIVSFDKPVEPGKKWDGRIGYTTENMVTKDNSVYSLAFTVDAPKAIVSGKSVTTPVTADADIRAQVFLPKSYELTSVQPEPFRKLFQYGRMVPTWTPQKLHIGDTILIKTSYSDVLAKIVDNDDRARKLKAMIRDINAQGKSVPEAENYLATANENNNKAIASFGGRDYSVASQYAGYAKEDITKAENSLSGGPAKETPETPEKTPGFEAYILGSVLIIIFLIKKKRMN